MYLHLLIAGKHFDRGNWNEKIDHMKVLAFVLSLVFSSALYAGEQVAQNPEDFTLQGVNRDVKFTLSKQRENTSFSISA